MITKREGKFKSFLKKVVAGAVILSSIAVGKAVASSEQDYYSSLGREKYSDARLKYEDEGKYKYMDRGMYDNRNFLNYLNKGQYESSKFFDELIYQNYFGSFGMHNLPPDRRIFTMPQTNNLAQSEYFRNLPGYENPSNYDMNFYLSRNLFNKQVDTLASTSVVDRNSSEYYKRKLLQDYGVKITDSTVFEVPQTNRMVGSKQEVDFNLVKRYYDLAKGRGSNNIPRDVYWNIERSIRGLNTPINDKAIGSNPIYGETPSLMEPIFYKPIRKTHKEQEKETEKAEQKFFLYGDPNSPAVDFFKKDPNSLSYSDIMKLRNYKGDIFREYLKNSSK